VVDEPVAAAERSPSTKAPELGKPNTIAVLLSLAGW
jgi:hypothetical protein